MAYTVLGLPGIQSPMALVYIAGPEGVHENGIYKTHIYPV